VRITRIEVQQKRPDRRNIYADGSFLIGIHVETLLRSGLRMGDTISDDQLHSLQESEDLLAARHLALRYLARRPRSEREVRDKLRDKEFGQREIDRVLADLLQSGLVNDLEFARSYIRNSLTMRPLGELRLKQKLVLLGVQRALIDQAMNEVKGGDEMHEAASRAARQFLQRSSRSQRKEERDQIRRRLIGFLTRRGFPWPIIQSIIAAHHLPPVAEGETYE
jgi:regulatory protein